MARKGRNVIGYKLKSLYINNRNESDNIFNIYIILDIAINDTNIWVFENFCKIIL